MYPEGELTELQRGKDLLRQRIARRRAECVAAATRLIEPMEWLEGAGQLWKKMSPWTHTAVERWHEAPAPAGLLLLRALLRWAPPAFQAASLFRRLRRAWTTHPAAI